MTVRQAAMLSLIRLYWTKNGYAPTVRDFVSAGLCSSTSVASYNLARLRERGLIDYQPGVARTVRVI